MAHRHLLQSTTCLIQVDNTWQALGCIQDLESNRASLSWNKILTCHSPTCLARPVDWVTTVSASVWSLTWVTTTTSWVRSSIRSIIKGKKSSMRNNNQGLTSRNFWSSRQSWWLKSCSTTLWIKAIREKHLMQPTGCSRRRRTGGKKKRWDSKA